MQWCTKDQSNYEAIQKKGSLYIEDHKFILTNVSRSFFVFET